MLRLENMTAAHFDDYMSSSIKEYALEKVQAGSWTQEDSLDNARLTYDRLLPDGLNTPNNFFFSIINGDNVIGYIWLGPDSENKNIAFIFDFEIYDAYQNNGFGSQAISLASTKTKALGFTSVGLHVFGTNSRAIHVYEKAGFEITDIKMQKKL
ncbi:GNAT family N-acetyltransferase [Leuconostoc suionicum]|uniref:GNAT family N-acetyltransferase n=1 Tax=Leuconostoc suionicum TaxID=1511761 RepID=UPI002953BE06|nr:GNAT family N-acetyltransferase [Leuconostoc suionicum]MDV7703609.1 GNAT family N-acetyltransferase [Leuconostoc suionicum]